MNTPDRYLALCLDPVHVGTGGYRLGRVDMSIVRDPASGIPQIPGTSLAGAIRAYAELAKADNPDFPDVPTVFGSVDGEQVRQGMLRFYDADVAFFPVNSNLGTVWITTEPRLRKWLGAETGREVPVAESGPQVEHQVIAYWGLDRGVPLQLGWLLLQAERATQATESSGPPATLAFMRRLAIVSDKLFFHLVNDQLEVRTSVEIDDSTGAAKDGALFTYEAIPRGTVMGFELAIDTRRGNGTAPDQVQRLLHVALAHLKLLGVGGMVTRGFGRLEVIEGATSAEASAAIGGDQ